MAYLASIPWAADKVERRSIASLVPYACNARMHSAEQIDQIAASIREWGWTVPVLVDEADGIIAGHGRVLAAHKLGIAEIPVMVAAGWTAAQKRAYVLADNKLALNAGWDEELLTIELAELKPARINLRKAEARSFSSLNKPSRSAERYLRRMYCSISVGSSWSA